MPDSAVSFKEGESAKGAGGAARLNSDWRLYRARSNTDSDLPLPAPEMDSNLDFPWRPRLYELFGAIEREFESLYAENQILSGRVEALAERLGEGGLADDDKAKAKGEGKAEAEGKGPKARSSHVGQKLKTALRVPPGRLVSSFKAGVGAVGGGGDASRVRFTRHFTGHRDGVWHLDTFRAGPDKGFVASASADQTARVWSTETGRCVALYSGHKGSVNSVAFSPVQPSPTESLCVLTAGGDQSAHIWRAPLEKEKGAASSSEELEEEEEDAAEENWSVVRTPLLQLTGHTGVVICAAWLAGGEKAITASWDRTAHIYDAERGEVLNILSGHDQELTVAAASAASAVVATASRDTTFRLWDFREAIGSVAVFQGHSESVNAVAFASEHRLVSGSDDRAVKVWDLRNMRAPEASVRLDSPVNRLSVSAKGVVAIPHDNRHVRLYTLAGVRIARLPRSNAQAHRRMVCATAWLDSLLYTAGFDKQLLQWKFSPPKDAS